NSLTLSPALTALLLRPRDKTSAPPLPRLAFPLVAGWFAWNYLTPRLALGLEKLGPALPESTMPALAAAVPWTAAILGAAAGWIVGSWLNRRLGWLFRTFNSGFRHTTGMYVRAVGGLLRVSVLVLLVYSGLLALTYVSFTQTPKGFIPSQDMGYLLVNVQ